MVGMEVGYGVIAFVPVHVDHHSVERADTWHGTTIARLEAPRALLPRPIRACTNVTAPSSVDTAPRHDRVTSNRDRKSTRLNSSHPSISYAVFCLKKKK